MLQWREELASAFWGRLQGEVSERWCQAKRREGCVGKTTEPLSRLETLRTRETEEGKEGRKKKTLLKEEVEKRKGKLKKKKTEKKTKRKKRRRKEVSNS